MNLQVISGQEQSKEGFSLKKKVIASYEFIEAVKKASKYPLEAKTAYNLSKIMRLASKYLGESQEGVNAIAKKYAKKDEKGNTKRLETGEIDFENEAEFKKEYEALVEGEVHFPCYKLPLDSFNNLQVEAEMLLYLEPIILE